MSLLGAVFGSPHPPPAPPAPPPAASDPKPEMSGGSGGASAEPPASDPTPPASAGTAPGAPAGGSQSASGAASSGSPTPVDASAVKVGFGSSDAAALDEDAARTHALKMQRLWRIADIATSLGAGQSDEPVGPPPAHVPLAQPGDLVKAARVLQGPSAADSADLAHRV